MTPSGNRSHLRSAAIHEARYATSVVVEFDLAPKDRWIVVHDRRHRLLGAIEGRRGEFVPLAGGHRGLYQPCVPKSRRIEQECVDRITLFVQALRVVDQLLVA